MQLIIPMNIPATRCLSSVETVRDFLRLTTEEVMAAIESGMIPFAWDLRTPGSEERSEIRIWHPTAESLIRTTGRESGPSPSDEDLARQLIPERDVRSSELERWWGISPQTVHRLIAAGLLPVRRSPAARSGPSSYYLLSCSGLRDFLASRRLTGQSMTRPGN